MNRTYGRIVLFGSGEASPTGRSIHRKVLRTKKEKQHIAIIETPAGFQPNSALVSQAIADIFHDSLDEFTSDIAVIPARKKHTPFSPDIESLLTPLYTADYIVIGPGSPSYTVRQLINSRCLEILKQRWHEGTTLCLSSAGALATGTYTLPVYEIYKAGADLFWMEGLALLKEINIDVTILTHWNNTDGGKDLDTRCCFMGRSRFEELRCLLPQTTVFLAIDEQTAIIIDPATHSFSIEGVGQVTVFTSNSKVSLKSGEQADLATLRTATLIPSTHAPVLQSNIVQESREEHPVGIEDLPELVVSLLKERSTARNEKNFTHSDKLRSKIENQGFVLKDTKEGQQLYKQGN